MFQSWGKRLFIHQVGSITNFVRMDLFPALLASYLVLKVIVTINTEVPSVKRPRHIEMNTDSERLGKPFLLL